MNTWHIDIVDRQINNCVWYFCIYLYGLSLNGWHAVLCITNNRHDVTITTHAIKRHFLIWMTTVGQPTKRRCSYVLTLRYTFICVYWWTRQRIHNTLIAADRYLRLMGDKTIPDSAEPRLESFYPPFVAGIDLPHQGVVDSYSLSCDMSDTCDAVCWRMDDICFLGTEIECDQNQEYWLVSPAIVKWGYWVPCLEIVAGSIFLIKLLQIPPTRVGS